MHSWHKYSTTPFFHLHTSTSNVSSNRAARSCNQRMLQHTLQSDWERGVVTVSLPHPSMIKWNMNPHQHLYPCRCTRYSVKTTRQLKTFCCGGKETSQLWLFPSVWLKNSSTVYCKSWTITESLTETIQRKFGDNFKHLWRIIKCAVTGRQGGG